jgi:hypothetical protein
VLVNGRIKECDKVCSPTLLDSELSAKPVRRCSVFCTN